MLYLVKFAIAKLNTYCPPNINFNKKIV